MRAVLSGAWRATLVGGLAVGGCMAQVPPATPEVTAQPGDATRSNHPVALTITCAELRALFKAGDNRTAGAAILWLDGYYAGRSGLSELPAGWARTVGQGVGGTCAISVNERRTVLDVIGQLHREYGSPPRERGTKPQGLGE
jgi:hypothetical protein